MMDKEFAKRLRDACDANSSIPTYGRGRQTWLKDQMEVSNEAVRKWFAGESRPRPSKMAKLAQVLRVDESWLALGVTPDLQPKERTLRNAKVAGAVNVFMGLVQLSGGHCAMPSEGDPAAEYVSFHSIREGTQTSYHVASAHAIGEGRLRITLPNEYSRCAVVGAIQTGPAEVSFIRMPHDLIEQHAVPKGGYLTIEMRREGSMYLSGEDRWPAITRID